MLNPMHEENQKKRNEVPFLLIFFMHWIQHVPTSMNIEVKWCEISQF